MLFFANFRQFRCTQTQNRNVVDLGFSKTLSRVILLGLRVLCETFVRFVFTPSKQVKAFKTNTL